jgi:hypothetical protein
LTADDTAPLEIRLTGDKAIKDGKGESCYWELTAPTVDLGERSDHHINVRVSKMKDMVAYSYGGDSRESAILPTHKKNTALVVGTTYSYTASIGQLLVALPTSDDAEFVFEYWISSGSPDDVYYEVPPPTKVSNVVFLVLNIMALAIMMVLGAQISMIRNEEMKKKAELEKDENGENALPVKQGFMKEMMMKMNMKKKAKDADGKDVDGMDADASKINRNINTMFDVSVYEA